MTDNNYDQGVIDERDRVIEIIETKLVEILLEQTEIYDEEYPTYCENHAMIGILKEVINEIDPPDED